jgi:hypothetical protein
LTCGLTEALGSGDGATGAGVDAAVFGLALFAFELLSVLPGSQAANVSDRSTTAKSFFVMICPPFVCAPPKEGELLPFFAGEWE